MTDLKPCPFCGGEALIGVNKESTVREYFVGCMNCHIRLYKIGYKRFYTEAEAIAAWNARTERTCEFVSSKGSDRPPVCSACGYELDIYDCDWFEDGAYGYGGNYCPNCGARVVA